MRNHGLKVLGLALLSALGMMAFTAAGAQATFLVNLGAVKGGETVAAKQEGNGFLLVALRDLKLECGELELAEGKLNSSTDGSGKATFKKCVSLSLSTGEKLPCELKTLETITANALALPVLHGGQTFVLFEPQVVGTPFTTVSYKAGTECPLPLSNPVTGAVSARVEALDAVEQTAVFSPEVQLLTGDKLAFGGNPSYIHATGKVSLSGANAGQKLGVH